MNPPIAEGEARRTRGHPLGVPRPHRVSEALNSCQGKSLFFLSNSLIESFTASDTLTNPASLVATNFSSFSYNSIGMLTFR